MAFRGRKTTNKNPPFFSHEFVIQNHADIVSCVALLFVVGLMIQATTPYAYMFIALHHNVTSETSMQEAVFKYTYGLKDLCVTFFYFLICIVIHAIIQEYILDKVSRKLHLSKVKHSKFNESGQLFFFYAMSIFWGGHIILKENFLLNISSLWDAYPHTEMSFMFKFFYIIQLAYWLHTFPELYFQKVKKEEMFDRVAYAVMALIFIAAGYVLNFNRVGVCLLVIHYLSEEFYHIARLIDFVDKEEKGGKVGYMVWHVVFVLARLGSVMLTVLTFWFGLSSQEQTDAWGDFNTPTVRIAALAGVILLQVYLMFNFITDLLRQMRETQTSVRKLPINKKPQQNKKKESKKEKNKEYDELPEVDQNTKKTLKQKKVK
ncbi:translocation associated membrane protein [Nesidiocoris tenuis]|uniref:Translocating chain-associated membrane protein n=1 Tax=Nesidiocoris tenuis TaxID=355587 RepID=A0ABN7AM79_9HEMI|nr:translocation associated membrane protein [Nesidiocoris tenuis]